MSAFRIDLLQIIKQELNLVIRAESLGLLRQDWMGLGCSDGPTSVAPFANPSVQCTKSP